MAKTKIQWVEYVFNPWWGCVQVSPACDHCYAMVMARRIGTRLFGHPVEWGPGGQRGYASEARWSEPLAWQRRAIANGVRHRVFCGSMMDVFEGLREQRPYLERLYALIDRTPNLDWLLLTKRPNNIKKLGPGRWPSNVWLGTTIENQTWADQRLPHLLALDCTLRFASVEPMLSALDLRRVLGRDRGQLNWVIFGGESGMQARGPSEAVHWYRDLRDQCQEARVPLFFKQWGSFRQAQDQLVRLRPRDPRPKRDEPARLDDRIWQQVPLPDGVIQRTVKTDRPEPAA